MNSIHIDALRTILATKNGTSVPGAPKCIGGTHHRRPRVRGGLLTGAGLTNMHLGLPDLGFMDLSQVVDHTIAIRGVVDMPLIVDADTGFGNALNVAHTVRTLERAGASAVQLEDQVTPKRCGHFSGKELVRSEEMVNKVKAAVDARRENVVIIARTDARAVDGFESALDRASRYIEAGADMTFVEAPEGLDEVSQIPHGSQLRRCLIWSLVARHLLLGASKPQRWGSA